VTPEDDVPASDITMIVHGPEAFDCGDVHRLARQIGPSRIIVAGVMGRTAAEESGLPVECCGEPPSRAMRGLTGRVILVNRGKTPESGRIFGEIVASRLDEGKGLIHLECSDETIYLWNHGSSEYGEDLQQVTGFRIQRVESRKRQPSREREIRGCLPGEVVCVNGIVIGTATGSRVVLRSEGGVVVPISGLRPKGHGLEKLTERGPVDISTAWCKSGTVRRALPKSRIRCSDRGKVLIIDHCGHEIYHSLGPHICGVLSIGDDTTAVCGHICTHLGIPVFGVVDGDSDEIVKAGFAPGSVVVCVLEGRDDDVGRQLAAQIAPGEHCWSDVVNCLLGHLEGTVQVQIFRPDAEQV
jgi:hypothetical protein